MASVLQSPSTLAAIAPEPSKDGISHAEIALYDRQIRLWGVQAQERLRKARVLIIGMRAIGNEAAKNLVLSGIGALTVVDDELVTEDDLGAQFLVSEGDVGSLRSEAVIPSLKSLNPRVEFSTSTLTLLLNEPSSFGGFDLVIATDQVFSAYSTINAACRLANKPFYAAGSMGMFGYIFADLISHDFVISRTKPNDTDVTPESVTRKVLSVTPTKGADGKLTELATIREIYTPLLLANTSPLPEALLASRRRRFAVTPLLSCLRALWEFQGQTGLESPSPSSHPHLELFTKLATDKHRELQLPHETLRADVLRSFLQNVGSEISPVAAFLGGYLAQDVINVIGGKEQPLQNFLIFDGDESISPIYPLHTTIDSLT